MSNLKALHEPEVYAGWVDKVLSHINAEHCYLSLKFGDGVDNDIEYVRDGDTASAVITLNRGVPPRILLYNMLHELGHYERFIGHTEDMSYYCDSIEEKKEYSKPEKIRVLIEEVLAWKKAEEIAEELEIELEKGMWRYIMETSLQKYTEWCNIGG